MSIDAMKQALEALEYPGPSWPEGRTKAAAALRLAIEQAERQEPVCEYCGGDRFIAPPQQEKEEPLGYLIHDSQFGSEDFSRLKPEAVNPTETVIPLYTAPPQRQPLTAQELIDMELSLRKPAGGDRYDLSLLDFARAIERAHGIGGGE